MADKFEPVKLRSPQGNLFTAHTPGEVNDLVYGHGYSVVGKRDVADVLPTGTDDSSAPAASSSTTAPAKPKEK